LAITPSALKQLGERGYDPVYGARPLKRLIQQELETPIAKLLVKGELRDGNTASVDMHNGALHVTTLVEGEPTPIPSR
jgi:ATP-dependent Clp protease ATP-binding subunit ClpB